MPRRVSVASFPGSPPHMQRSADVFADARVGEISFRNSPRRLAHIVRQANPATLWGNPATPSLVAIWSTNVGKALMQSTSARSVRPCENTRKWHQKHSLGLFASYNASWKPCRTPFRCSTWMPDLTYLTHLTYLTLIRAKRVKSRGGAKNTI